MSRNHNGIITTMVVLAILAAGSAGRAVTFTYINFEPPTYLPGDVNGQDSPAWVTFGAASNNVVNPITSLSGTVLDGTQSLEVFRTSTSGGGAYHPFSSPVSTNYFQLSFKMQITGSDGHDDAYVGGLLKNTSQNPVFLRINNGGVLSTTGSYTFNFGGSNLVTDRYAVTLSIDVVNQQYAVAATNLTHSGPALDWGIMPFAAPATAFSDVFVRSDGYKFLVDDLLVEIPEPGALWLFALGGLLLRRR